MIGRKNSNNLQYGSYFSVAFPILFLGLVGSTCSIKNTGKIVDAQRRRIGADMEREKREKLQQKKEQEKFNSGTGSVKPRNQNQQHNVRLEGIGKQNKYD
jgi:hypothetical protein